jgi:DNA-binding CsgD family transcriptional regulator
MTPMLESISDRDALGTLTRKEQEVALMAARGMTKREIADSLCVSVRTVGNHINHLYAKLGVMTRDELRAVLRVPAEVGAEVPAPTR